MWRTVARPRWHDVAHRRAPSLARPVADRRGPTLSRHPVAHPLAVAQADGRQAIRGTRTDSAGTTLGLPAQGLTMWVMDGGLRERITEHVIEEAQKAVEALRS